MVPSLIFGVVGVGLALGARYIRESQPVAAPPAPMVSAAPLVPVAAPVSSSEPVVEDAPSTAVDQAPQEFPLTEAEQKKVGKDEGVLEVVAGRRHEVWVDGKKIGRGVVKVVLAADGSTYEVTVKMKDEERVRTVTVKKGMRVRLRVAPPWSR